MTYKLVQTYRSWDIRKRVGAVVFLVALIFAFTAVIAYALESPIQIDYITPVAGEEVTTANVTITAQIYDSVANLNGVSGSVYVDGIKLNSTWQFQGHVEYDSCGDPYYVITSNREGTLTATATNLTDGTHTASVTISDVAGNVNTKEYTFNVASPPIFTDISPADTSVSGTSAPVSVKITDDNGPIYGSSVTMKINDEQVAATWQAVYSTLVYNGQLPPGSYTVWIDAADASGNSANKTWSFTIDDGVPVINLVNIPVVTNGVLAFETSIADNYNLAEIYDLRLDGQPLSASFRYEGVTDSCGEYVITDRKKGYVSYQGIVPDGTHNLTLSIKNILGNTGTKTWTLNVATYPVISENLPTTYLNTVLPVISAKAVDVNTGIDPALITMTVDGAQVPVSYNETDKKVTYTPVEPLQDDSIHTVILTVYDKNTAIPALGTTKTWKFSTTTYPDMKDSNFDACNACHTTFHGWNYGGSHSNNQCNMCHQTITVPASCYQCHGTPADDNDDAGREPGMGHGWTPDIQYGLRNPDPNYILRVAQNRETFDCIICHQPGSGAVKHASQYSSTLVPQINHDIPELHKGPRNFCSKCHAVSLTREHAREGRFAHDGAGNDLTITCNTCHKSTDPKVIQAINNNDKSCTACHTDAHRTQHTTPLDSNCQSCHQDVVSSYHKSRDPQVNCLDCHEDQRTYVRRTINIRDMNCGACHPDSNTHNVMFANKVPADITLPGQSDGFQWTTPIEAYFVTGKADIPDQYSDCLVVLSSRNKTIDANQLWNTFSAGMSGQSWTLKAEPDTSASMFTAEFTKGTRKVYIRCYNTELSNGTGNSIGYRLEVWYK